MRLSHLRRTSRAVVISAIVASLLHVSHGGVRADDDEHRQQPTPIKHVVVIFQENVSFDHYFATYPQFWAAVVFGGDVRCGTRWPQLRTDRAPWDARLRGSVGCSRCG